MDVRPLDIADVKLVVPRIFHDERGWFQESYSARAMAAAGIDATFVQDNHSLSRDVGTVRGLHFQVAPYPQGKLVRVIRGAVFDVAVDIRGGSPTYGRHVSTRLDPESRCQMWIPPGFAHGFCTLEPDTEVAYKVTAFFSAESERGIRWDDPALGIQWPVSTDQARLSERDRELPPFRDLGSAFASR